MHESNAMDFITSVLRGFVERTFKIPFDEKNKQFYLSLIGKIRDYIEDEKGYWVREKSLLFIDYLNDMETIISKGEYIPESPELCIDAVLLLANKALQDRIDEFRTDKNKLPKQIYAFYPLPKIKN